MNSLFTGNRLGPYEIVAPLGAGGMGEVFRAHDTNLGRDVAIKVLPAALANDPERLARFKREAQLLAALNHPNVAAIYGLDEADGKPFLVLELVPGEDLAERLKRGAIPVDEAIAIAKQIAEALEEAHEKGIVHRDLKPANVKLTPDGKVKVLDFGLAKAYAADPMNGSVPEQSHSPTLTRQGTEAGMILGTAAYMSPEQARGKPVDKRADIWAFGVVLLEMLTGRQLFHGETVSDTLAAVLTREPDLRSLPEATPLPVRDLIARCLRREPRSRQRDMGDARLTLEDSPAGRTESQPRRRRPAWRFVVVGVASLALGAVLALIARGPESTGRLSWHRLTFENGALLSAGFVPGGDKIVFSAEWNGEPAQVYTTRLGLADSKSLVGAPSKLLSVSRTGELAVLLRTRPVGWFVREGTLARVSSDGGAPRELTEHVMDAAWSPDGSQLAIVRRDGTHVKLEFPPGRVLYETPGNITYPRFSPRGDRIAFLDHPDRRDNWGYAAVVTLDGRKTIWSPAHDSLEGLVWSPSGEELWYGGFGARGALQLFAAGPDQKTRLLAGAPGDMAPLAIDAQGRVLASRFSVRMQIVGAAPGDQRIRELGELGASLLGNLSADGDTVFFSYRGPGAQANYDSCVRPTRGGPVVRLGRGYAKTLSPDGKWAATLLWTPATIVFLPTGAGEARSISLHDLRAVGAVSFHPDGRSLVFAASEAGQPPRLWVRALEGDDPPRPVSPPGFYTRDGRLLSPDGDSAVLTGPDRKLWLAPVAGGDPKPISGVEEGEIFAGWSADGSAIYLAHYRGRLIIDRLTLASGTRKLWREAALPDLAGAQEPHLVVVAPEAGAWAAAYDNLLGELYLIEGLK